MIDTIPPTVTHLNRDPIREGATNLRAPAAKPKFIAKGHDAQLQDAQFGRRPVTLTMLSGDWVTGTIAKRDKFTITVAITDSKNVDEVGCDVIYYKHGIESVRVHKG